MGALSRAVSVPGGTRGEEQASSATLSSITATSGRMFDDRLSTHLHLARDAAIGISALLRGRGRC